MVLPDPRALSTLRSLALCCGGQQNLTSKGGGLHEMISAHPAETRGYELHLPSSYTPGRPGSGLVVGWLALPHAPGETADSVTWIEVTGNG